MPDHFKNFRIFHSRHGTRWRVWDFMVGLCAFCLSFYASPWHTPENVPQVYYLLTVGALYGGLLMVFSRLCAVPNPEDRASRYELVSGSVLACVLAYLLFAVVIGLVLFRVYGRWIIGITMALSWAGLFLPRLLLMGMFQLNPINIVIYGAGQNGIKLLELIRASRRFNCLGFLDANDEFRQQGQHHGVPVLGGIDDFGGPELQAIKAELVVVSVRARNLLDQHAEAITELPLHGIEVLNKGAFIEKYFKEISVEYGCPQWFASSPSLPGNPSIFFFKRLLDLGFAAAGLLVSLPFWPCIALAVKLSSPGPVFFLQRRVGYRGRIFQIIKFRTMRQDAEREGPQWATRDDQRATQVGRLLRLTRLDELPQLVNVLMGQMTMVGPRPERPEFVAELVKEIPYYEHRHLVPPGLTGWAQVMYRYGASKEDALRKLCYDLYYVRHLSVLFDIEILLRTIPMIMKGSR